MSLFVMDQHTGKRTVNESDLPAGKLSKYDCKYQLQLAMNSFTTKMFRKLCSGDQNVFCSGYSVNVALAMLAMGTEGLSLEELKTALDWDNIASSESEVIAEYHSLCNDLNNAHTIQILTANSIWFKELKAEFISRIQHEIGAEAFPLTDAQAINSWGSKKTNQLIKNIVDEIDPLIVGVLVNVIYFKGDWEKQFDVDLTSPADFTLSNSSKVKIPMMNIKGSFPVLIKPDGTTVIELPYKGLKYSMIAFLPPETSLTEYYNDFNDVLARSQSSLKAKQVRIYFPKFKLEYSSVDLIHTLKELGISNVFKGDGTAGLSRLTDEKTAYVSSVYHKAVCIVDEKGTEACAVTAVTMKKRCRVAQVPEIHFNRPFLFAICARKTRFILFMGAMHNPSQ